MALRVVSHLDWRFGHYPHWATLPGNPGFIIKHLVPAIRMSIPHFHRRNHGRNHGSQSHLSHNFCLLIPPIPTASSHNRQNVHAKTPACRSSHAIRSHSRPDDMNEHMAPSFCPRSPRTRRTTGATRINSRKDGGALLCARTFWGG